jgi:hypothetical protein
LIVQCVNDFLKFYHFATISLNLFGIRNILSHAKCVIAEINKTDPRQKVGSLADHATLTPDQIDHVIVLDDVDLVLKSQFLTNCAERFIQNRCQADSMAHLEEYRTQLQGMLHKYDPPQPRPAKKMEGKRKSGQSPFLYVPDEVQPPKANVVVGVCLGGGAEDEGSARVCV